jgi:DnaJ family protein C protein 19
MLWLAVGALTLFLFLGGLRAFEQASVTTIKSMLWWIAVLGGLTLALLLVLTGREGLVLGAAVMFGPMLWRRWRAAHFPGVRPGGQRSESRQAGGGQQSEGRQSGEQRSGGQRWGGAWRNDRAAPGARGTGMSRQEAYEVLGLRPGASEADIRAAYHRVIRTAHPDTGGSDWLAARVNMARDILLNGRHA